MTPPSTIERRRRSNCVNNGDGQISPPPPQQQGRRVATGDENRIAIHRQRLSIADRIALVRLWYRCEGNMRRILSLWRRRRNNDDESNRSVCGRTVVATIERFHELGSVCDRARSGRSRSVRVDEIIRLVRESVRREPMLSTRKRAQRLNLSRSSLMRIQKLDLGVRAYKVQMAQHLLPMDAARRLELSRRILREIARDDSFVHRLIMGDEAHFDLSGGVFNRQNVRFWGTQNPRIVRPRMAHSVRVTVWCGVSSSGIIGPYFFEDRVSGRNVSVTGERYREMLRDYVEPLLRRRNRRFRRSGGHSGGGGRRYHRDRGWWWWQQDGATAHTAQETMTLLRRIFGADRIISRGADISWPPRSPDLSAADYFLWGYLKDCVYGGGGGGGRTSAADASPPPPPPPPRTIAQLKETIVREVASLNEPNARTLLRTVMENFITRASACSRENGGHLRDVIFHT